MLIRHHLRALLAGMILALAPGALAAQPFTSQYGSNPIGKINGSDFATSEFPGQTRVQPNYTARYGIEQLRGGSYPNGRFWDARLNGGSGLDPKTGVLSSVWNRNPFLRQWWNIPGAFFGRLQAPLVQVPFAPGSSPAAAGPSAPTGGEVTYPGFPAGYQPIVPGSYGTYGYSPRRAPSPLPSVIGGVLGVVAGSMVGGGVLGMVIGGAAGFLGGRFLADQLAEAPREGFTDNVRAGYYNTPGEYGVPSSGDIHTLYPWSKDYHDMYNGKGFGKLTWLPGVAGGILGATLGAGGGAMGMIAGGVAGYLGGNVLSKVINPQGNYDAYGMGINYPMQDPYNNELTIFRGGGRPSQIAHHELPLPTGKDGSKASGLLPDPGPKGGASIPPTPPPPAADPAPAADVATLKANFLEKVEALEKAATGGADAASRQKAHQEMEEARNAYMKAKIDGSLE